MIKRYFRVRCFRQVIPENSGIPDMQQDPLLKSPVFVLVREGRQASPAFIRDPGTAGKKPKNERGAAEKLFIGE